MSYLTLPPYYAVPVAAGTVTIPAFDGPTQHVLLEPAGLLASLNIVLPTAADGQTVVISISQAVTTLALTSAAGSVLGAITSAVANALGTRYTWSATSAKWFRT